MLKEAEAGSESAMFEVAMMYYYGLVDDKGCSDANYGMAYYWLKRLAETENPYKSDSLRIISSLYYRGLVPHQSQSYKKSYECLKKAVLTASNLQHMAFMTSIVSGCEFDLDKAERLYKEAAQNGDAAAMLGLANMFKSCGRFKEAGELYEQIYVKIPQAALELGRMNKLGVLNTPHKPDYFRAQFYYQHAIQSKIQNPEPYLELGVLYFNPTGGFPNDFEKAQECFIKAADLGNSQAQYMLGFMYWRGHVEYSLKKAVRYLALAAEQGHILAALELATIFQQSEVCDYQKAFHYARVVAQGGLGEGAFIYVNLLFLGRGCEANVDEAIKYYRFAVDYGYARAKFMLEKAERIARG